MIRHTEHVLDAEMGVIAWQATAGKDASIDEICSWLAELKAEFDRQVEVFGGVLLRGFDQLRDAGDFERVLTVLTPNLLDYVGGSSPRVAVRGRIMTATETPSNRSIPLHQEMSYTNSPPARIAFFCQTPASEGGETTLADMRRITARLDPEVRARFERRGAGWVVQRCLSPVYNEAHPAIRKPWTEVFNAADADTAEKIANEKGFYVEWIRGNYMKITPRDVLPVTRTHPKTGSVVWFNQVNIFAPAAFLSWAEKDGVHDRVADIRAAMDNAPELLDRVLHGDGTLVSEDDALHIQDVLESYSVPLVWERGDLVVLDNILTGHGRRPFSGERVILAGLIGPSHGPQ